MVSYAERGRRQPADFRVSYRFLRADEGGRSSPPRQHTRWDFRYEGDDPQVDGNHMIWSEFLDPSGLVLPEGEVPMAGQADMFILSPARRDFHAGRIRVGLRGLIVEGNRTIAECTVVSVLGLHSNPRID